MLREPFKPGDRLTARDLNEIMAALQRLESLRAAAPLAVESGPTGSSVSVAQDGHVWIKLTGGGAGGEYDWTRMTPVSGGGWAADPSGETGTTSDDPATEVNGNATIATSGAPVVRAYRDPGTGMLFFQKGTC